MNFHGIGRIAWDRHRSTAERYLPIAGWLPRYRAVHLPGDLTAGVIVAVMLVPQSMAYALLAGLPPKAGLYASVAPLLLYAIFGASRAMAVGPTALVSILVASAVAVHAPEGGLVALAFASALAACVGVLQLAMGLLRLGFLVNFLSQPVVAGFTGAAALIIGIAQLGHLAGLPSTGGPPHAVLGSLLARWPEANGATLIVALGSVFIMWIFKAQAAGWLRRRGVREGIAHALAKVGPLVALLLTTAAAAVLDLSGSYGVAVVGRVPAGLPPFAPPQLTLGDLGTLAVPALTIAVVAFMESISIAKTLAGRRREGVEPNLELRAFGIANLAAAVTGGFPVSGGLSRSLVNHSAGARSLLASLVTAALVIATLLLFTPLFAYLPHATLATVVIFAVSGLVNVPAARKLYHYSKADFAAFALTALVALGAGVQIGVATGVGVSLLMFLWRASHPHIAVIGRVAQTEHYRNILNYPVETCPEVLAVRIDESLFFANAKFLEENLLQLTAAQPTIKHLILVCSAVNAIDASALETLERLVEELGTSGVKFHLAEVKGPVMARLIRGGFANRLGADRIHLSTHQAMTALGCGRGKLQEAVLAP